MSSTDLHLPNVPSSAVRVAPADIVRRRSASWKGIQAEAFEITRLQRFEYSVVSPLHLLIVTERAERENGETLVEGGQKSTLRKFNRRLSFIPAGRRFYGWQDPRVLWRATYLYIDPAGPLVNSELRFPEIEFKPRLFFFDQDLWETAFKIKVQVEHSGSPGYVEALSLVLAHELIRLQQGAPVVAPVMRGGLAGRQQREVADYIEDRLDEEISLQDLAAVAQLSPFHFARAFKETFGEPPHRYLVVRRMERAKALLKDSSLTVTEIGLILGFSETSSFTAAFRRLVGTTPTNYRRSQV
jgi:AraC family transcriptional regulator